ncbi:MAG: polyphosphate polymerase domain-containing protein [Erysipelotrichaceae bacterium]
MDIKTTFKRYELKYLISKEQQKLILDAMKNSFKLDDYGATTIRNIYFDCDDYRIIRYCLQRPTYKEKLRIRSYGDINPDDIVFVELKKKYLSVVYKRRLALQADKVENSFKYNLDLEDNSQIAKEIDYYRQFYNGLKPAVFISYQRNAYYQIDDDDLRITFDQDICYRDNDFSLNNVAGTRLIGEDQCLMEIKTSKAIPLSLATLLCQLNINKTSFSKYGAAYSHMREKGGFSC